ncbi:hypothetical protein G7Y89_g7963 [Cudoniella acicularis]|uniref:Uncharacterized protein n=1 Tax=Cudoniella acicularis TaxID=354080 RepID=A0A8H4RHJ1_9HELO|nr:hypothetical protein G7Y89_g7963 [Cudoniella acicularis]
MSQFPQLSSNNLSGYPSITPTFPFQGVNVSLLNGFFLAHSSPFNSPELIVSSIEPILAHIKSTWPSLSVSNSTASYPTWLSFFNVNHDSSTPGSNLLLSSRLLGASALAGNNTGNLTSLENALKGLGGSDAVSLAWRTALSLFISTVVWVPQNAEEKSAAQAQAIVQTQFLRDLELDSGTYINEANVYEPDWQNTF